MNQKIINNADKKHNYRFVKAFEFNFNFGTLISVDFSSCCENSESNNITEAMFDEIIDYVEKKGIPNIFWFKGINESVVINNFETIIKMIREIYPNQKIGVYLNCGIFQDEEIINVFYECDLVAINLNTVEGIQFSKINKCPDSINPFEVLKKILDFSKNFKGQLGIYTMFLKGINDTMTNVKNLKDFLLQVKPDHFSISNYTLDGFKPVSKEFQEEIKKILNDLPFKVIFMF
ncbi:MAG: hypothetical protein ACFFEY_16215 [Candidatus Thorarchaeota archaeon]